MKREVVKELMTSCLERRGHQTWNVLWKVLRTDVVGNLNTQ